jgi:hypothetical protein
MTALAVHARVPVDQRRVSRDAVCVPSSSQQGVSRSDLGTDSLSQSVTDPS